MGGAFAVSLFRLAGNKYLLSELLNPGRGLGLLHREMKVYAYVWYYV